MGSFMTEQLREPNDKSFMMWQQWQNQRWVVHDVATMETNNQVQEKVLAGEGLAGTHCCLGYSARLRPIQIGREWREACCPGRTTGSGLSTAENWTGSRSGGRRECLKIICVDFHDLFDP